MQSIPSVAVNNCVLIEQLGYGVYKVPPADTAELVSTAIGAGYHSIDTAALYGNEAGVGQAVREAAASGPLSRSDLFVTTKIWNEQHGYDAALNAFSTSLRELGLDYVDMLLVHWPCPARNEYVQTYRALQTLYRQGLVRTIGVSNFEIEHLQRLLDETDVVPAVNQIELHPALQQRPLRDFCARADIRIEAWSPLGRGTALEDPTVLELAGRYGRSTAQIVLRWHLQLGHIVIPKASSTQRIRENRDVFDFELDAADMERIAALDSGRRIGSHPAEVN